VIGFDPSIQQTVMSTNEIALTSFLAPCADRNPDAMAGAQMMADALALRLHLPITQIGAPDAPNPGRWDAVLDRSQPSLSMLRQHCESALARGAAPLIAMARCASSVATLPAVARRRPEAKIVWFDAHADCNTPDTTTSGYLGGMVISATCGLWDSGFGGDVDPSNVILVGARDIDVAEQRLIETTPFRHVPVSATTPQALRDAVGDAPVYVHLDCDVLAPGLLPTEYAAEGGLSFDALTECFRVLARNEVLGVEIAELQSHWPHDGTPAPVDALLSALEPLLQRLSVSRS
jgi:arginase